MGPPLDPKLGTKMGALGGSLWAPRGALGIDGVHWGSFACLLGSLGLFFVFWLIFCLFSAFFCFFSFFIFRLLCFLFFSVFFAFCHYLFGLLLFFVMICFCYGCLPGLLSTVAVRKAIFLG